LVTLIGGRCGLIARRPALAKPFSVKLANAVLKITQSM
jgi:hypothetical protein